ncbi:MAG: hypothetical protein JXA42_08545 [Anaerolineales bacterium]|nr:hypothetical protein [Anaerolineales bacterium]
MASPRLLNKGFSMPKTSPPAKIALSQFAAGLTAAFNPEDQLRAPVKALVTALAQSLRHNAQVVTEVQVEGLGGRQDVDVALDGLLVDYI